MDMGARSLVRQMRRAVASVSMATILLVASANVPAQMGPIQHDGFLEYQFRVNRAEDSPDNEAHLATWRAHASTWVWQPYILQLDGSLGLTRGRDSSVENKQKSTFVTGSMYANAFARSHFPFRAYFEAHDSRVEGGVFERDLVTRTWGMQQQYFARRGGNISVDFRQVDTDELSEDGVSVPRDTVLDEWQFRAAKSTRRNEFRLLSSFRDFSQIEQMREENRNTVSLRHRFRTSPRFFIEDTTFFSDEKIAFDGRNTFRKFLQFNGMSTWRPETRRPLHVIGRVLARGTDAGSNGSGNESQNFIVTGSANYQYSRQLTFSGNIGATMAALEDEEDESGVFQRVRAAYRANDIDIGKLQYSWGASLEAGNRSERTNGEESVQDVAGSFNHGLTRFAQLGGGRQLQVSITQQVAAIADTSDRQGQTLVHSAFLTLNRQNGRVSNYVRLSASDRRAYGDNEGAYQLVTLQGSARMHVNRKRSWNGGVTLQYNSNSNRIWNEEEQDNSAFTYSVNLSYLERDLFKKRNLNFLSELRLLSSDFRSNDILDQEMGVDSDRDDKSWRNRLDYRIGRLELQLLADVREINNRWMSQVFFTVRRFYGDL